MVDLCKLLISEGADVCILDYFDTYETLSWLTLLNSVILSIANKALARP